MLLFLSTLTLTFQSCKGKSSSNLTAATDSLSDDALMDTVLYGKLFLFDN